MGKIKKFILGHFEPILIFVLLIGIGLIDLFALQQLVFLNFYYLPVLAAGYVLGKRGAVLTGVAAILLQIFRAVLEPEVFLSRVSNITELFLSFFTWGGFLILAGYVVGILYEEKEKHIHALRRAYIGVIEILTKFLESVDHYTKGHSVRVADLSMDIATAMGLSTFECENIQAAALLHDIGKIEISTDIIRKAAALTKEEREIINTHMEKGANILAKVGEVLSEAIPIVLAHHKYFCSDKEGPQKGEDIPLGARIIAVADAYDAMVTDRSYRRGMAPWQAVEEIKKGTGIQFDPGVVDAFQSVIAHHIDR